MATHCRATNRAGAPCSAAHFRGGWCRWHDPDLADERRVFSVKGGKARSNHARATKVLPRDVLDVERVRGIVGQTIRGVIKGDIEPGVGNCVANLCRVSLAATEMAVLADFDKRLADLESIADAGTVSA